MTEKQRAARKKNLKPFQPGQSGNPAGRKKGSLNKATVLRKLLDSDIKIPDGIYNELKNYYPHIQQNANIEDVMDLIQIHKAITKGDTRAWQLIKESVYGKDYNISMSTGTFADMTPEEMKHQFISKVVPLVIPIEGHSVDE